MKNNGLSPVIRAVIGAVLAFTLLLSGTNAQAAIVQVQKTTGSTTSGTSVAATFGAMPANGNLLIAIASNYAASTGPTTPGGWTLIRDDSNNNPGIAMYFKVAGASEPTAVTVSGYGTSTRLGLQIFEYSGLLTSGVLDQSNFNSGTDSTLESGNVTTTQQLELVMVGTALQANSNYSSWSDSFTEQQDFVVGTGGTRITTGSGDRIVNAIGTYSTVATAGTSGNWRTIIASFKGILPSCPGGVVTTTANSGGGSLRECIEFANMNPGTTISFNIPGPTNASSGGDSWWRISPVTDLPNLIGSNTVIDGRTQTTNQGNTNSQGPEIEIQGAGANTCFNMGDGTTSVSTLTIRDLAINKCVVLVDIKGSVNGVNLYGNYLGTNPTGMASACGTSCSYGIYLDTTGAAPTNINIGGEGAGEGNIISGIDDGVIGTGIVIGKATSVTIKGNKIGLNRTLTATIPIRNSGISIGAFDALSGITIGGTNAAARNYIGGGLYGVDIRLGGGSFTFSNINIYGNTFGTGPIGTENFASSIGVRLNGTGITFSNVNVGGVYNGEGNTIAYNQRGIDASAGMAGVKIQGNTIRNSTTRGISLSATSNLYIAKNLIRNNTQESIYVDGSNTKILHNTVYATGAGYNAIRASAGSSVTTVRNNIIANNAAFGMNDLGTSISSDYNNFFANALGDCGSCTIGANSITTDPQFVNPGGGDFTLQSSSNAINKGVNLGADQPDMNGASAGLWDQAAPDMGAFEGNAVIECIVTNTTDAGAGSLRQCLTNAQATPGTTIKFNILNTDPNYTNGGSGTDFWWRIVPGSALPTITANGTIIDGTTQTANQGNTNTLGPEIEIDGINAAFDGLKITSSGNTIRGLAIGGFKNGSYAGTLISSASATGNTVAGNYIGLNPKGTSANANFYGVYVTTSANGNTIGGIVSGDRNVISGNSFIGIILFGVTSTVIKGNYIGTNASGTTQLPNSDGISISGAAASNTVGGNTAADRNVISGNTGVGVNITSSGADSNVVQGNYIGVNASAGAAVPNGSHGVSIVSSAKSNIIGGSSSGDGNVISGSTGYGISITGIGTDSNIVRGNYIGTNESRTASLGNGFGGVRIGNSAKTNVIGGTGTFEGNTIAFNTFAGVNLTGVDTDGNQISGNAIYNNTTLGIDLDPNGVGTGGGANNDKARPTITSISPSGANFTTVATVVSGDTIEFFRVNNSASPTVIADLSGSGEGYLYLGKCIDNGACTGPHINAVADANAALGTVQATLLASGLVNGDLVTATAWSTGNGTSEFAVNVPTVPICTVTNTTDGGAGSLRQCLTNAQATPGMTISFNIPGPGNASGGGQTWWKISPGSVLPGITQNGTIIDATTQTLNQGNTNTLGPEIEIDGSLAGDVDGLVITSANNQINSLIVNGFNNAVRVAVKITGAGATGNVVKSSYIGTNYDGTASIPNKYGVHILAGAATNTIGGSSPGDGNIVSGNSGYGVYITSTGSGNVVKGNYIGTDRTGTLDLGNTLSGVVLNGPTNTTIGGTGANDGNIISGNNQLGLYIGGTTTNVFIYGNTIGTGVGGTEAIGNTQDGIRSQSTAATPNIQIGGLAAGQGNLIAKNNAYGITLWSTNGGDTVQGNTIRDNAGQGIHATAPNIKVEKNLIRNSTGGASDGIRLDAAATNAKIYHNTIHGNGSDGIEVQATGAVIKNNIVTGNSGYGVNLNGGTLAGEGYNLITGNATTPANALGQVNGFAAHASDLNVNPLYTNPGGYDFTLQNISPAVNRGCDLGTGADDTPCDDASDGAQPDMNGAGAGNFNGFAPDMGYWESAVTNTCNVSVTTDGNNYSTLRGCIIWANSYAGADNIYVPAGTYTLTIPGTGENAAATGDLDITDALTITGSGKGTTIINGGGIDRVFDMFAAAVTVNISDLTITNGNPGALAGGIYNSSAVTLTLTRVGVTSNVSTGQGGGINNPGTLILNDVDVTNNTAGSGGGGIFNNGTVTYTGGTVSGNLASSGGGGIASYVTATMTNVTISGNTSTTDGGGVYASGTVTLNNSTVSGNTANTSGGGIFDNNTVTLNNSTVSGNTSPSGGGILIAGGTTLNLTNATIYGNITGMGVQKGSGGGPTTSFKNTIIAGNAAGNCSQTFTSGGYNLESATNTCGFTTGTDQNTVTAGNLNIGALANNGGPTQTHALIAGSFAIDKIPNGTNGCGTTITTDQRGTARPQNGTCDVGAFEYSAPPGYSISGRVFEDADFAGTAADYVDETTDKALANVDVELYTSADVYVTSTNTDASGNYSFTGLANATYKVRVRAATIADADTTPKGGLNGTVPATWPYPIPELAWANGSAMYGGQSATVDDTATGDNAGPGDNWLSITVSGANISNVNFGYAYNLIVNVDDDGNADNTRSKQGSLRQFIKNANAIGAAGSTTANYSQFRMQVATNQSSGADAWWRFTVNGINLPAIADGGTTLDGSRQRLNSGADSNTLGPEIEIFGNSARSIGLNISAGSNNTIQELVVNSFTSNGISVGGATVTLAKFYGNYLGTNATGSAALPNGIYGLYFWNGGQSDIDIGGSGAGQGNLISGNGSHGMYIAGGNTYRVFGNIIGLNRTGTAKLANGNVGFQIENTSSVTVGGAAAGQRNIISGNSSYGISMPIGTSANGITIKGNTIGSGIAGTESNLGNSWAGINVGTGHATPNVVIGGLAAGEGNLIGWNAMEGIISSSSYTTGYQILGNTLRNNTREGIRNAWDNVTISANAIHGNGTGATKYDGINLLADADNNKLYHNTLHGNGKNGILVAGTNAVIKNNAVTGNGTVAGQFGLNVTGSIASEAYNLITDASTTPANFAGRSNIALAASDLNANPLYTNAAGGVFTLTECNSPAINSGVDLVADQPDMNGASGGNFNGYAPDIGAYEAASCSLSLAGTVYTDEGVTNIGAGKTVRVLVNGLNRGSAVTAAGGTYSITTTYSANDALLVYIDGDDGTATDATTVTVTPSGNLSGINLYVDHLIVRHDNAGALTNALMSTAKGAYSDTEILYSVSGGNLTVSGATTELYVPAAHTFTPGGNVSTMDAKVIGTLNGGANTFTVAGNWNSSGGTVAYGSSTLNMTGVGKTFQTKDAERPWNLTIGDGVSATSVTHSPPNWLNVVSNDLVLANNATLTLSGIYYYMPKTGGITLGAGATLNISGGVLTRYIDDSSSHISTTGTISGTGTFQYDVEAGSTNAPITARTYDIHLSVSSAPGAVGVLGGGASLNLGAKNLYVYDVNSNNNAGSILDNPGNIPVTATELYMANPSGSGNAPQFTGTLICRGATYTFTNVVVYSSTTSDPTIDCATGGASSTWNVSGNVTIDGSRAFKGLITAGASNWNVGGNWSNSGTFTAGTSTVTFNGTNQSITGNTTFNNLTKSVATARTLTFAASSTTTVNGTATLNGASGQLLTLASSSPGTHWNLNLGAASTKAISYVSVSWGDASGSDASKKPVNPTSSTDGGNNIAWFGGTATITVTKLSTVISDPFNGASNPKRIPGAVIEYSVAPANSGTGSPDANSVYITDVVDSTALSFYVTGGVSFTDGATSSALALGAVTYSNTAAPGPYVYTYTPAPDGDGYDGNITSIRANTTGTFAFGGAPAPSFTIKYRVKVK